MGFFFDLFLFAVGSGLVALCLVAIPGPHRADSEPAAGHGHAPH